MTGGIHDDIDRTRFPLTPRPLPPEALTDMTMLRAEFNRLAHLLAVQVDDCRARSLALTALQEARMWAVQAVVDTAPEAGGPS